MSLTHQDIIELHNLVARYCITTDNADADGFMECWVSAEEFGGYDSGSFGQMQTWQELYEFEKHHVGPGGMANGKRHQATNLLIEEVAEGQVHITHDLLVFEVAQAPRLIASGRYNKSVAVKTEQGWRYKSRHLHVDPGSFILAEQWKAEGQ